MPDGLAVIPEHPEVNEGRPCQSLILGLMADLRLTVEAALRMRFVAERIDNSCKEGVMNCVKAGIGRPSYKSLSNVDTSGGPLPLRIHFCMVLRIGDDVYSSKKDENPCLKLSIGD